MTDTSFEFKLPPEVAAAMEKLTPEQRAIFDAACSERLAQLLPLVTRTVERSQTAAAMMADLPPAERADLYATLARGLAKLAQRESEGARVAAGEAPQAV